MTMYGGDRDDDADEWLNAPLTDPDGTSIRPAIVSWLDMLRQTGDPQWEDLGGTMEGVTPDIIADLLMEEGSPTTNRNLMLEGYGLIDDLGEVADDISGAQEFKDNVEEHIMGYPRNWNRTGRMNASKPLNFTSKDPLFTASADTIFDTVWDMMKAEKGKFQGYSKNRISGRAERQGKARAWSQSRKVKRGRTRKRYARNKKRGNVRPQMRRQLGAGGKREQVKR